MAIAQMKKNFGVLIRCSYLGFAAKAHAKILVKQEAAIAQVPQYIFQQ